MRASLTPLVAAIFPVPKIALLPLFIIWFGIGEASKVGLILFGTFFPTVIATYGGVDNVDRSLIRMGQSFGLSRLAIARKILLPGAMPAICPACASPRPSRSHPYLPAPSWRGRGCGASCSG